MQLIIAEKPSVARDLARVLGVRAGGRHALEGPGRVITWCIGHLVELEEPAAYDGRWKAWRLDTLPMLPAAFKLRAVQGTRDQLRAVRELLRDRRFNEVVNACDAGREGELIFRYVYELAGSGLPVRRLWISSLTDEAIRHGFGALRPGRDYDPLADAARCRSEADWLVGLNATRAVTVKSRGHAPAAVSRPRPGGRRGRQTNTHGSPLYSIGRVQTPTLAIVVRREEEIQSFQPRDYWEIRGTFTTVEKTENAPRQLTASWGVVEEGGKTRRSRLGAAALADAVVARVGQRARATDPDGPVVERLRQRQVREAPPQLFDLTSLQRTANRRYGLSATRTLAAAQSLYERHKILTYPRTDSRHLSGDMLGELPKMFRALGEVPDYAPFAATLLAADPPPRNRRVFDDAKVHDHHAIIPTGKAINLDALERDERHVFDLVARRFLGVFFPDAEFAVTDVVIRAGAAEPAGAAPAPPAPSDTATTDEELIAVLPPPPDRFFTRGRVRLVAGWQEVAEIGETRSAAGKDAEAEQTLPPLREGQRLDGSFEPLTEQTRPPPRHTEATLLGAMEYAGRDIEDEALRAAMRDTGLGTPATRAATIETLIKREFVVRDGKHLVPTEMGMSLIRTLPVASLASPELTGAWEARLARIARGQDSRATFMTDIARYVTEVIDAVRGAPAPATPRPTTPPARAAAPARTTKPAAKPASSATPPTAPLPCPACHEGTLMPGKRGWGCTRWQQGCTFVIWFEAAGRKISDAELRDLVSKGKTRKRSWQPPGQAPISGRLVLDLGAPREAGAARFEA